MDVECRHQLWHTDEKRYAQASLCEYPYETKRHNIAELTEFYKSRGLSEKLVNELVEKVTDLYKQPTPEEAPLAED